MSDHTPVSTAETQNAKNIIALAKLLYQKGVLKKCELARIFDSEFEMDFHDFIGKFPLELLPETAGFIGKSPETTEDNHICSEVPKKQLASIRKILESEEWKNSGAKIPLAIGKNVSREPVILDLNQIRNLFIIGTVGNDKGTLLNSIVLSLLYRFSPDELQLLIYAPEQAISGICRTLPHLSQPPMTSPEEVRNTFEELVEEIKRRRRIIAAAGMDDLTEYNASASPKNKIPRLVFIIDDLIDEMRYGRVITKTGTFQIDNNLIRIVQKGWVVGIYLILGGFASGYIYNVVKKLFPDTPNCSLIQAVPSTNKLADVDILTRTSKNKRHEKIHATLTANCDIKKVVESVSKQART